MQTTSIPLRSAVGQDLHQAPIIGVVRTRDHAEAARQARVFIAGGLKLVEITFTVPRATELVRTLRQERGETAAAWIGMGTVTDRHRAEMAVEAGAEFLVSPNATAEVTTVGRAAGRYLVVGALTPTEIVAARQLGADIVKVYPLPPVGGPDYLATVRGPLGDIPMLAAGGFGVDEIPAYREAGAIAFGIGAPLLAADDAESHRRIARALALGRGEGA